MTAFPQTRDVVLFEDRIKAVKKPIVLYGMGNGADGVLNMLCRLGVKASGVFASDDFARYQDFRGFTVKKYSDIISEFGDVCVLLAFGTHLSGVIDNIKRILKTSELYAPDMPPAGGEAFSAAFFERNSERLERVFDALGDERSQKTFACVVKYKLTGELKYLFDCETDEKEIDGLLALGENETYVDVGAYRGDTVRKFLNGRGYKSIIAVEPGKKSFEKLSEYASGTANMRCVKALASSETGAAAFDGEKGRGASCGLGENVRSAKLDDILEGETPTFMKFDVEGMEEQALAGAAVAITEFKPKITVSAYHKSSDLFLLPEIIKAMRSDYRVYLRHLPCVPAWDVNYYFV